MLMNKHVIPASASGQTWPTWDGTLDGVAASLDATVATSFISMASCKVTTDLTLYVYRYNSTTIECVAVSTSGKVASPGTPFTIDNAIPSSISCVAIDSTHVLVCYGDNTNVKTRAVVIAISGTTCSKGTIIDIDATAVSSANSVALLNTNRCVMAYNSTGSPQVVCITISGTTATKQTDFGFTVNNASSIAISTLTSSTLIAVWGVSGTQNINNVVLSVSTNTITAPTAQSNMSALWDGVSPVHAEAMDATHFVAMFVEVTTGSLIAFCSSVSSTTISSPGTKAVLSTGTSLNLSSSGRSLVVINSGTAIVAFRDTNIYLVVFTLSGTTITPYTKVSKGASSLSQRSISILDAFRVAIGYANNASPPAGFVQVLSIQ